MALGQFNRCVGGHEADEMAQRAWLLPSLLLRAPIRDGGEVKADECLRDLALTKTVRRRVQMVEQGLWTMLLQEYMSDMEAVDERSRQGHA
eukprot:3540312-Lingulodinium_polyedra.AAC.1